jgi:ribonuclease P protein subunit POP4
MIAPRNILRHELTGLDVSVIEAANPSHVNITGRIIEETKNTLLIRTSRGDKRVQKLQSCFRITLPDGTPLAIDGSALATAPERRITQNIKIRGI